VYFPTTPIQRPVLEDMTDCNPQMGGAGMWVNMIARTAQSNHGGGMFSDQRLLEATASKRTMRPEFAGFSSPLNEISGCKRRSFSRNYHQKSNEQKMFPHERAKSSTIQVRQKPDANSLLNTFGGAVAESVQSKIAPKSAARGSVSLAAADLT
jgi:hypothetical protein